MAIEKIWTSEYRRVGAAAYAESGRRDLDKIADRIATLMQQPGALFFRLEKDSVFLGYLLEVGGQIKESYIRPQFRGPDTDAYINSLSNN